MKLFRRLAAAAAAAGVAYGAASYFLARRLAARLVSPTGLGPAPDRADSLRDAAGVEAAAA